MFRNVYVCAILVLEVILIMYFRRTGNVDVGTLSVGVPYKLLILPFLLRSLKPIFSLFIISNKM